MKVIRFPSKKDWPSVLQRPCYDIHILEEKVRSILEDVKANGDQAVHKYTAKFDKADIRDLEVSQQEFEEAEGQLPETLKKAIQTAASNIKKFHGVQKEPITKVETMEGVTCWRKAVAVEKVGLYIPGGSAPLFSTVLMLGIPAVLAGCKQVILCSPPSAKGILDPAILYAASLVGISRVFKVGGAQAIGAMAYGTNRIPAVYKIFGPGNQYVTCAKQMVSRQGLAIDMPAGPSEVAVFADESCITDYVAADLLSQAEHGKDSQVLLFTTQEAIIEPIQKALEAQLDELPRRAIAIEALKNSRIILTQNRAEALAMINVYAPEHLILSCKEEERAAEGIVNAGSVFLGNYSPESAGDYASGTNHTLPTSGYAKSYSGISVDSFVKKITFQKLTRQGLWNIAPTVEQMASAEHLDAHKNAVSIRK